jgi:hypothetical protein
MTEGQKKELPVRKSSEDYRKRTIYPSKEADEIYALGSLNGWDVSKIAREAFEEAMFKYEAQLKKPAPKNR